MISFKQISEDEYEGPLTPDEPLLSNIKYQSCEESGPMPVGLVFRSSKSFITFVVCLAVFTDAFLYTLIIPILPDTLTKNAGVPPEDVQYWTSILLSAFGAANLFVSRSTIMYCFGRTPLILVIARGFQGASAAVIWVVGLALLSDTMGASGSGGAMGWTGIGRFTGTLLGPSLGGVVYEFAGHYAVFGMAFAVLFFDIILRLVMIERKVAERWISFSHASSYGATDTTDSLSEVAEMREDELSRTDTNNSSATIYSKISVREALVSQEMGIIPLLMEPRILAAMTTYFTCSVLMTAMESVLSLYTIQLFHWTAAESGLIFVTVSFSIMTNPYIGRLTDRHSCRGMSVSGLVLGAFVWLGLCLVTTNTTTAKIVLSALLLFLGFSAALMVVPNMVEISRAVDTIGQAVLGSKADPAMVMGRAYSLLNMSWGFGSIVGPLWGGAVVQKWGWVVMCLTFVGLQGLSSAFAYRYAGETLDSVAEEVN